MITKKKTSVVIVGGGIQAKLLALLLHKSGIAFVLLSPPKQQIPVSVVALNLRSVHTLETLGVWKLLSKSSIAPFYQMDIWSNKSELVFSAADVPSTVMGYTIFLQDLHRVVDDMLANFEAKYHIEDSVLEITHTQNDITLSTKQGRNITGSLVVGADGANSMIRKLSKIGWHTQNYQQQAIVGFIESTKPHLWIARQCFLPTGPLAFLPLHDPNRATVVWSADKNSIDAFMRLSDDAFCTLLSQQSSYRLGTVRSIRSRQLFPLSAGFATRAIASRVALIGDAFHKIHPMAGQGLNLGIMDLNYLHDVIHCSHSNNQDLGAVAVLRRYERARRSHNYLMLKTLNLINGFSTSASPFKRFSFDLGLSVVSHLQLPRRAITYYASGLWQSFK